jgi:FkbM family methyltransferase
MILKLKKIFKLFITNLLKKTISKNEIYKLLEPHVYALIVKSNNGIFAIDPKDNGVGGQLKNKGGYGLDEVERLLPFITPNSKVLIVGAHVGTLTIPISKVCKEIIAIEANPDTFDLLKMNLALNSISNCCAINIAVSDKNENIEFLKNTENSGGSKRVPKIKELMYYFDTPEKISIKAFNLDNYFEDKNFDIVIMDIEGSEYYALQGMQEILSQCKLLVVEFLPHHLRNVSGVTVEQFLSLIQPHFSKLSIPSKSLTLDSCDFMSHLTEMYNLEEGDEGIFFSKL